MFFHRSYGRKIFYCKAKLQNTMCGKPPSLFLFIFLSAPTSADRQTDRGPRLKRGIKEKPTSKQAQRSEEGFPLWVTDCTLSQEAASPAALTPRPTSSAAPLGKSRRRGCSLSALPLVGLTHTPRFRWTGYQSRLFTLRGRSD